MISLDGQTAALILASFENPEQAMYQCGHYELVASALAVRAGHEINPEFQIGNMIAMVPIYPYSCRPEDMMLSVHEMHNRWFFCDVQCRGHYPAYALKMFERKGFQLDITDADKKALEDGTVDYIGFSYYMTDTVDSTAKKRCFLCNRRLRCVFCREPLY